MKFKTYRIIDICVLCALAFGCDMLATFLVNTCAHRIRPFPVVGLLISFLAISRWEYRGLIVLPFSVIGNFISGRFLIPEVDYRTAYTIGSLFISLLSCMASATCLIWYKKYDQEKLMKDNSKFIKMILSIILISLIICVMYSYISNVGNNTGNINFNKVLGPIIGMLLYNAFGYIIFFLGSIFLKNQEVLSNVERKLKKKVKETEAENRYYNNYRGNKTK